MEPFVLSPESAAKFFMLSDKDSAWAEKNKSNPNAVYKKLQKRIKFIADNRDLLTDYERAHLAAIIDLSGLKLFSYKINLSYCVLNNSRFFELTEVRLVRSSLRDGDFSGAYLTNVCFNNADLTGANFKRAELSYVDFAGADLTGADFTDVTRYVACSFVGAKNLDKAIGLPPEISAAARQAAFGAARQQPAAQGASPA